MGSTSLSASVEIGPVGSVRVAMAEGDAPARALPRRALIYRAVDFWVLGGLSLVLLAAFAFTPVHYAYLLFLGPFLHVTLDFPHFMASYRMAYTRDRAWQRSHWIALYAGPGVLLALLFSLPFLPGAASHYVAQAIASTFAAGFMWHRSRQAYGCMVLYSVLDGYKLDRMQKLACRLMLNALWICAYISFMAYPARLEYYGIELPHWSVPSWLPGAANAAFVTSVVAFIQLVIVRNALGRSGQRKGQWPSVNFLVAPVSAIAWAAAYFVNRDFFLYLCPSFHALQSLGFTYAYDRESRPRVRFGVAVLLLAAGWLGMQLLPGALATGAPLAFFAIYAFFTYHHYMLDSVIWRSSDREVSSRLLGRA